MLRLREKLVCETGLHGTKTHLQTADFEQSSHMAIVEHGRPLIELTKTAAVANAHPKPCI